MAERRSEEEPEGARDRQPPPERNWRVIVIWIVSILVLLLVVYLFVAFVILSPQREAVPEAEDLAGRTGWVAADGARSAAEREPPGTQ